MHSIGRHATGGHEPRQVRKEAAISDAVRVVGRSRSRQCVAFSIRDSIEGAQPSLSPDSLEKAIWTPSVMVIIHRARVVFGQHRQKED